MWNFEFVRITLYSFAMPLRLLVIIILHERIVQFLAGNLVPVYSALSCIYLAPSHQSMLCSLFLLPVSL